MKDINNSYIKFPPIFRNVIETLVLNLLMLTCWNDECHFNQVNW